MRTAPTITLDPEPTAGMVDEETIFNGLLLAVIGRRRLLVLIGDSPAARVGLLARLARHLEADGTMVMTVAAALGVTVEDLIEVAGSSMLGPDGTPPEFEALVESLEDRLDQTGAGVMMVEEADRLSPDTLRDLVDLSGSITPSGRFLQVLLSGGPELRRRLEVTDLLPTLEAVGTIYSMTPTGPMETADPAGNAPVFTAGPMLHRQAPSRKGRWLALAMIAVLTGAGGLYLHESGVLDDRQLAQTLGLDEGQGDRVDGTDDFGQPPRSAQEDQPIPANTRPTTRALPPGAPAAPDTSADEEAPLYPPEEVARLNELANRDVEEMAAAARPAPAASAGPDEIPPPAESQPLDEQELEALETAEQQADTARTEDDGLALAPPPAPPRAEAVDQRRLRSLAEAAEAQFAARKLTTPQDDNAFTTMQEIRALDPDHPLLADLKGRILDTYRTWASTAESRQDWQTARVYYQRALRVDPANADLATRLDAVNDRLTDRPAAQRPAAQRRPQNDAPPEPRLRP